jgi:hypothetical protein
MTKVNIRVIILFIIISLFQLEGVCQTKDIEKLTDSGWKVVESRYCTILCHPDVDINRVNKRVRIKLYDIVLDKNFYSSKNNSVEGQVAEKFDRIFVKAEKILDMYPRKIHPTVKIFKNQSQLDDEYARTFGHPNRKRRISYYVHKYTTIYTTEQVVRAGILAHEMGHAITDHYFLIPPPEKVKELLAQYVELHLED